MLKERKLVVIKGGRKGGRACIRHNRELRSTSCLKGAVKGAVPALGTTVNFGQQVA